MSAAREGGACVVMASQSGSGRVMAKRAFVERGFAVAGNLPPRKIRILLMLALTQTRDIGEIQRMILTY